VSAHDKDINTVAVSPNGAIICTGSQDRTAKLWRTSDLAPIATLKGHKRGVWQVRNDYQSGTPLEPLAPEVRV